MVKQEQPPPLKWAMVGASIRTFQCAFGVLSLVFALNGETPWAAFSEASEDALFAASITGGEARALRGLERTGTKWSPVPFTEGSASVHLDSYGGDTTTENKSWYQTLCEMLAGFICFGMSVGILWLNEGHVVRLHQLMGFAKRRVKEVPAKPAAAENDRELVFLKGESETTDSLALQDYCKLSAPANSAKLRAQVSMFQWVEHKKQKDKTTTYEYKREWKEHQVNSTTFRNTAGHENPACPLQFLTMELAATLLGDFALSKRLMGQLQNWKAVNITEEFLMAMQNNNKMTGYSKGGIVQANGSECVRFPRGHEGCGDEIGDLRICFQYVPCGDLSVLGVQVRHQQEISAPWTFVPLQFVKKSGFAPTLQRANTTTTNLGDSAHQTLLGEAEDDVYEEETRDSMMHVRNGCKAALGHIPHCCVMAEAFMRAAAPDQILLALESKVSVQKAFDVESKFEAKLAMTIRCFGFMLMWASLFAIFAPLRRVFSYLWFLGAVLNAGIYLATLFCACTCSCCTIASAWLAYRPLISMLLVGIPVLGYFAMVRLQPQAQ